MFIVGIRWTDRHGLRWWGMRSRMRLRSRSVHRWAHDAFRLGSLTSALVYCSVMPADKVTGPASYFPSIEKKYGKPISHWKSLLKKMKQAKHSEMVAMLKTDHGMGHGHANAIVAHFRAEEGL